MKRILSLLLFVLAASACISNDIPYPVIKASINSLEVEGAIQVNIDKEKRKVEIELDEAVDIRAVNILSATLEPENATPSRAIVGKHDLSQPEKVILRTYQDYSWTIVAEQHIERSFRLDGQIGEAVIDEVNCRAVAKVPSDFDITALDIVELRLGPEGLTSYNPQPSQIHNFTNGAKVDVTCHGRTQTWTLFVEFTDQLVELLSVNAWTAVAWFEGRGVPGEQAGFRYRKEGGSWVEVACEVAPDGKFSACVEGLEPETAYEVVAYSGEAQSSAKQFETESARQLPNAGFETWSNAESAKYFSLFDPVSSDQELQSKWWDDGNSGSTTIGSKYAITLPDYENVFEGECSAKLKSEYVIIKFAAGNLFSGEYYKTIGTSGGVVRLGRPFTQRPRKLRLHLKYNCGVITEKTFADKPEDDPVKVGDNDRAIVYVALGDWDYRKFGGSQDSPVEVNTTDKSSFFDPQSDAVIAYGQYVTGESTEGWIEVEIPLEYRSLTRKPTHIIVLAAASMLGDYFTGSADSVLWIDGLQLEY